MAVSTFLTMVLVPVMYTLLARFAGEVPVEAHGAELRAPAPTKGGLPAEATPVV